MKEKAEEFSFEWNALRYQRSVIRRNASIFHLNCLSGCSTQIIVLMFLCCAMFACGVASGQTRTSTGFYYPTGTANFPFTYGKWLNTGWEGYFSGYYHLGYDLMLPSPGSVYAISKGTVAKVYSSTDPDLSFIWIAHDAIDPKTGKKFTFWAVYGHLIPAAGIKDNASVEPNQVVGTTMKYGTGDHVHFAVNMNGWFGDAQPFGVNYINDANKNSQFSALIGWGRGAKLPADWGGHRSTNRPSLATRGFVDPIAFIQYYSPPSPGYAVGAGALSAQATQAFKDCYAPLATYFGAPTSSVGAAAASPNGTGGYYQRFGFAQDGILASIYLASNSKTAYAVYNEFSKKYDPMNGTAGALGFPISSVGTAATSRNGTGGCYQRFEGRNNIVASIYISKFGVFAIYDSTSKSYEATGGTAGPLGFPTSDIGGSTTSRFGTAGACQRFEGQWDPSQQKYIYGSIYTSKHGAFPVYGAMTPYYEKNGGTTGFLGYPIGAPVIANGKMSQDFEGQCVQIPL